MLSQREVGGVSLETNEQLKEVGGELTCCPGFFMLANLREDVQNGQVQYCF